MITSGPEGAPGHLEPNQKWCFHVRTARWSLKTAIDPKIRLVKKTHTELMERLQADPRVFLARPYIWLCGKTLGSASRRSISSVWVFLTSPSGCQKLSIFGVLSFGSHSFKIAFQNKSKESFGKLEALWFQNCPYFLFLTFRSLRKRWFTYSGFHLNSFKL